jgi:hypothetical protein
MQNSIIMTIPCLIPQKGKRWSNLSRNSKQQAAVLMP